MCGIECIVCTVREKDSWVLQVFDVIVSCSELLFIDGDSDVKGSWE